VTRLQTGWYGVRTPTGARDVSLLQNVQVVPRAHPACYLMRRSSFQGLKRLGLQVHHSPPSSAEVKNGCSNTLRPLHAFMTWKGTLSFVPFHIYTIKEGIGGPMKASLKCGKGGIIIYSVIPLHLFELLKLRFIFKKSNNLLFRRTTGCARLSFQ
jgi:hypothetical protein